MCSDAIMTRVVRIPEGEGRRGGNRRPAAVTATAGSTRAAGGGHGVGNSRKYQGCRGRARGGKGEG